METFISILRGINVSGHKKILMSDLKALYESLNFKDVTTYIQSGNVVFKTNKKTSDQTLAKELENAIYEKYNFIVPVIIRKIAEMKNVLLINPFLQDKTIDTEKLHVTFLATTLGQEKLENIKNIDYAPDKFIVIDKEVFLYCPNGYGNTKLSNAFFEKKLNTTATTRNWKTVNKLIELADNHL